MPVALRLVFILFPDCNIAAPRSFFWWRAFNLYPSSSMMFPILGEETPPVVIHRISHFCLIALFRSPIILSFSPGQATKPPRFTKVLYINMYIYIYKYVNTIFRDPAFLVVSLPSAGETLWGHTRQDRWFKARSRCGLHGWTKGSTHYARHRRSGVEPELVPKT